MPRELKTVASNLTFSLISGSLIDLKVSSNDVKHITRVDCLYVVVPCTYREVQIVFRLFLVNCYLLHEQIETEIFTIYVGGLVIH